MDFHNEKDFLSLVQQYCQAKKVEDSQQVATAFQEIVDMMAKHPTEVKQWQDWILRNLTDVFHCK